MGNGIFITGTDTDVGKTVATMVIGSLLQNEGINVGVMKPVQCAGNDAQLLKKTLGIEDPLQDINPYYSKEPLSPHLAFSRRKQTISIERIKKAYRRLSEKRELMLVEGAGGLMVPLKTGFLIADLIKALGLDVVIVARLGLGTINHTLLTVRQARDLGLNVKGVVFNAGKAGSNGVPERTNPQAVRKYGNVDVLGTIPRLKDFRKQAIVKRCGAGLRLSGLYRKPRAERNRVRRYADWDKGYLWHPFTQMQDWLAEEPLVIERAGGRHLTDTHGRRYLDGTSSLWVNVHGHGHKRIDRAVKEQVSVLSHSTLLGLSNTPSIKLARALVGVAPGGLEKVFYSDNGSTAVEIAVKMAYQFWQNTGKPKKTDIAHLSNSYHGDTLGSVSIGGIDLFHRVYRNLTFKTICVDFPDCYRAPNGKSYPDYAFEHVDRFEQLLRKDHAHIAAFVAEPIVQGAAGMIMWPEGILKRMRDLCRRYDVIFIADEVATGFGRTGRMFACDHEGVTPDILCLAKGLTGGYLPLAATLTTKRIFDGFCFDYKDQKTFFHGHTYTGNPLCCAAALANLEVFQKDRILTKLQPKIKYLSERLSMFYNLAHVGDIRQRGFMVGIELVEDRETKTPFPWEEKAGVRVCQEARKRGVILRPLGNVIVIMPPLSTTRQELSSLLEATYESIEEVTGAYDQSGSVKK